MDNILPVRTDGPAHFGKTGLQKIYGHKKHIRSTVPKAELRNSESLDYIFNINDPIILDQILALEQTNTQNASLHPPATPFFSLNFDHSMINILHDILRGDKSYTTCHTCCVQKL